MGKCPIHYAVPPRLEWCRVTGFREPEEGRLHLGARCPSCRLWLRWLPHDTPGAPLAVRVEPFRRAT